MDGVEDVEDIADLPRDFSTEKVNLNDYRFVGIVLFFFPATLQKKLTWLGNEPFPIRIVFFFVGMFFFSQLPGVTRKLT